jgi:hypothetical protein
MHTMKFIKKIIFWKNKIDYKKIIMFKNNNLIVIPGRAKQCEAQIKLKSWDSWGRRDLTTTI